MGFALVVFIVATTTLFCGSLVGWTYTGNNVVTTQVRKILTRFTYGIVAVDLSMWLVFGLLSTPAALVALLCDVWAMMDAAIRYPIVPQGLTFFSAKFIALLSA